MVTQLANNTNPDPLDSKDLKPLSHWSIVKLACFRKSSAGWHTMGEWERKTTDTRGTQI
jgi:hypothetical protein